MVIIIYGNTLQKLIINDSRSTFYKEMVPVEGYPENLKMLVLHFYYIVWFYDVTGYTNILFHAIDIENPVIIVVRIIIDIAHGFYKCTILWTQFVCEVVACVVFSSVQDTKSCLIPPIRTESYRNRFRIRRISPIYFESHLQYHAVCILTAIIMYLKFRKTLNYMNKTNISSSTIYM